MTALFKAEESLAVQVGVYVGKWCTWTLERKEFALKRSEGTVLERDHEQFARLCRH